ncbi:MAG TPA: hypothetical protein VMF06_09560 [Candidatus Limnocylindria bacterium]|jgi:hypothetical protein|nr:hypothetical protein [Candidatus Limnocylindria bacterium]
MSSFIPRRAKDPAEAAEAVEFFKHCRRQIEHEDTLVNQRLTWFITFQGFLFTAYGFSMMAESSSLTGRIPVPEAYERFIENLLWMRHGMVGLGILSSFIALLGVMAAYRAVKDNEKTMEQFPWLSPEGRRLFPHIIGAGTSNLMGILCGTLFPFLTGGGWIFLGNLHGTALWIAVALLTLLFVWAVRFTLIKLEILFRLD